MENELIKRNFGRLEYHYEEEQHVWIIDWIESHEKMGGSKLIKEFVEIIGSGENVVIEYVIEKETRNQLMNLGYVNRLLSGNDQEIEIKDKKQLGKLKLVNVQEDGGVHVDSVKISKLGLIGRTEGGLMQQFGNIQISINGHT